MLEPKDQVQVSLGMGARDQTSRGLWAVLLLLLRFQQNLHLGRRN